MNTKQLKFSVERGRDSGENGKDGKDGGRKNNAENEGSKEGGEARNQRRTSEWQRRRARKGANE